MKKVSEKDLSQYKGTDPIILYMRNIGHFPLLKRKDEIVLGKKIEDAVGVARNAIFYHQEKQTLAYFQDILRQVEATKGEIKGKVRTIDNFFSLDIDPKSEDIDQVRAEYTTQYKKDVTRLARILRGDKTKKEDPRDTWKLKERYLLDLSENMLETANEVNDNLAILCLHPATTSNRVVGNAAKSYRIMWSEPHSDESEEDCTARRKYTLRQVWRKINLRHFLRGDLQDPGRLELELREDKKELLESAKTYQSAMSEVKRHKKKLIESNLRLVVSIAKRYQNRGLHLLDLIQEGNIGLMKAVDKFEYQRGYKFSTYGTWWIRQAITRGIADQAKTIRFPVHMIEQLSKVTRMQRRLEQHLARKPTDEELASELNMPLSKVRKSLNMSKEPISLSKLIGDDGDTELGSLIEDTTIAKPDQQVLNKIQDNAVRNILKKLKPREEKVIRMRFGIEEDRTYTLEEVGVDFSVTRERIRQVEAIALRKLRGGMGKSLEPYAEP